MRSSLLGSGLAALALTAALCAPLAQAEPSDPDRPSADDVQAAENDADQAKSRVERIGERLDAANAALESASVAAAQAAERWNGARWQAQQARKTERAAVATAAKAEKRLAVQQVAYRDTVITYGTPNDDLSAVSALVSADGMEDVLQSEATADHIQALLDQQQSDFIEASDAATTARKDASEATDDAETKLSAARTARDEAAAAAASAASTARAIESRKARLIRTLARLQGVSVAVAKARRAALEQERATEQIAARVPQPAPAPAPSSSKPDPAPAPAPAPDPAPAPEPAPSPGHGAQAAISFARAQIGEPYQWGASGPGSWDCSGLTAQAWAAGGKSLPHYSVAQYDASTPVGVSDLRPGDLVFWGDGGGPGSIYHVALYAGNGMIIHAPRTGRPVTEESMYYWRTPDFYARP